MHQGGDDIDLTIVTMSFEASDPDTLLPILSRYVVVSRGHAGCRNIDFLASATNHGRFVIVEKWDSPDDQQQHFDSDEMIAMANACDGLLSAAPNIDLLEPITAHDLT